MENTKVTKKRGFLPALSELTNFHGKKKKETINSTSSENEVKVTEASDDELDIFHTSTEGSTSTDTGDGVSGSSCDDINRISRRQRTIAKMSVRRDKKKEKEKREKIEKNIISMDDFLNKHAEFLVWLEEEKHKSDKKMSSPKQKMYFKEFLKLWNKKKLPAKYYRGSTDTESPCPTISRAFIFDEPEVFDSRKQLCKPKKRLSIETANLPESPFSTFGKTPPKLLQSPSIRKLETHHENDVCNGYAAIGSPPEYSKDQVVSEYQVPVKQKRCESLSDQESNKENKQSPIQPYSVTPFAWASGVPPFGDRKDSDLSSDHFSAASSNSTQSHDFPVYAQPIKSNRVIVPKTTGSISSSDHDSPPPIPPPLKGGHDHLVTRMFSSDNGDYKSVEMDENLPPPPPPMECPEDESMLNATLPPPPPPEMDQTLDDSIMNATLPPPPTELTENSEVPSPPGYAEIEAVDSEPQGEWKPPSTSKVYSPRKFQLKTCTSKERIYTEIPPPIAPKPKRKMFFDSVYGAEDSTYVEMNSNSVSGEKVSASDNASNLQISYSDYTVPIDVINGGIESTQTPNSQNGSNLQKTDNNSVNQQNSINSLQHVQSNEQTEIENHYAEMNCQETELIERDIAPFAAKLNAENEEAKNAVFTDYNLRNKTSMVPHIFRNSGKGCSEVFGSPVYCSIDDMVEMDSNQEQAVFYDQIHQENQTSGSDLKNAMCAAENDKNTERNEPNQKFYGARGEERNGESYNTAALCKISSSPAVLETDLDMTSPPKEVKKTLKRNESAETIIW